MEQSKVAYTVEEFCTLYGIGRSFAYEEMKAGHLRIRKAGRRTLILRVDAEAWLSSLPEASAGAA